MEIHKCTHLGIIFGSIYLRTQELLPSVGNQEYGQGSNIPTNIKMIYMTASTLA